VRCVSWPPPTSLSPLRRLDRPKGRKRERERESVRASEGEQMRAFSQFFSRSRSSVRPSVVRISRSHTPVLELVPISIIPAAMHRESVLPRYRITMDETVERSDMRTASDGECIFEIPNTSRNDTRMPSRRRIFCYSLLVSEIWKILKISWRDLKM